VFTRKDLLKNIMIAVVVLFVILGTVAIATQDNPNDELRKFIGYNYPITDANRIIDKNVSFSFEQTVTGNGYYMTYKYAKMGNSEFKDYAHGSDSLDNEAILTSYNSIKKNHLWWSADWNDYNVSCIQYKETTHAVYAPTRIAIGTGYYAGNPLNYDSLIKENTWLKNRFTGTSMQNEVEYAHKLDKDLSAVVKDLTNLTYDPRFTSNVFSQMKIKEDVTEGKTHIGVLQAKSDNSATIPNSLVSVAVTAWKKPAIEIDEDYFGTFYVEKNMTLAVPNSKSKAEDGWLPCSCNAGWDDMVIHDTRYHSAKGFFDCTTCWPLAPCPLAVSPKTGTPIKSGY
jgi:hypothetical protein